MTNSSIHMFPAISVSQPIGEFFLCSIPADLLLNVTFSIPATIKRKEGVFSEIFGNQRKLSEARSKQIGAYVDEDDSTFPNTIILSANYRDNGDYEDNESLRWRITAGADGCSTLFIPSAAKLASIIDGQHRLEGFKASTRPGRTQMGLPCAVYMNLPRPYQARIFATININQKRVDKSLAYELFGYDLNQSDSNKWPPDMLGVYLARVLESEEGSPFKGHVKLALIEPDKEQIPTSDDQLDWKVSVACLVEGVIKLISQRPAEDRSSIAGGKVLDRSQLPVDSTPLRALYLGAKDKTLVAIVSDYFTVVKEMLWRDQSPRSFIIRTVGILALFDVLRDALLANRVEVGDIKGTTELLLRPAKGINFSDDFFHASGAGRVRIRNVLGYVIDLPGPFGVPIVEAAERLREDKK